MTDSSTPSLSRDEVAKVASLALLELTEDELETFTGQLGAVLAHAKDIENLDVGDVEPTSHPYAMVNVFRPDEVEDLDVHDAALAAAPHAENGQFRVPPALGEEPG